MNGRNLLRFTGHPTYAGSNTAANRKAGWCLWNSAGTIEDTEDGLKFTQNGTNQNGFCIPLVEDGLLKGGADEVLTISFKYRGSFTTAMAMYLLNVSGGNVVRMSKFLQASETEWLDYTETFYFPSVGTRTSCAILLPYRGVDGAWLEIKDGTMKLEYGTTATPWRPAPEDTEQPSDLVYASEGVDLGDTSGDKLIANINLAGDTAKISAAHVEINGQTTFNAIKQYSDAAYDASGAASGAVDGLKTDLASASGTTVINGGHIETGSLTIGHVSGLQSTLNSKADDADVTAAISTAAADATSKANAAQAAAEATAATDATTKAEDAKKYATNYIALDPVDGIRIANANPDTATTYQKQTSTSTEFVVEGTSMAEFGSTARIGVASGQHVTIDQDSLDIMNGEATLATFGETAVIGQRNTEGSMNIFLGKSESYNPGITEIIRWADRTSYHPYFKAIHDRNNGNDYVLIGSAGGTYPGYGNYSVALGQFSWQTAGSFGRYSIAEGKDSRAGGEASHAQNLGTIAAKCSQTAIGTYNEEDTSSTTTHPSGDARYGDYALIIGNGTSDTNRSNAHTLDWQGNAVYAGDVTDGTGNVLSDKADQADVDTALAGKQDALAASSTTTVGDFFTAANGVTVVNGQYVQWGKVAQFYLNLKYSSNIDAGNITNINLGTIAAGKRPAIKTACGTGEAGPVVGVHVFQGGGVTMGATATAISAGTAFSFGATYILA